MMLVIGGARSGRRAFVEGLGAASVHGVSRQDALSFADELSSGLRGKPLSVQACLSRVVERISSFDVAVATEMGCGVVPADAEERAFRDANGLLNQALAKVARRVVWCVCGVARTIKGGEEFRPSVRCAVFRHGQTEANAQGRFAGGGTDCPLTAEGVERAERMAAGLGGVFAGYEGSVRDGIVSPERVFVSPMARARETAGILFPDSERVVVEGLREMRMGLFENMTHEELSRGLFADGSRSEGNAALYREWLSSNGALECPSRGAFVGESVEGFSARVASAFRGMVRSCGGGPVVVVAHGGVQMAVCDRFFLKAAMNAVPYFAWQSGNVSFRFGEIV